MRLDSGGILITQVTGPVIDANIDPLEAKGGWNKARNLEVTYLLA